MSKHFSSRKTGRFGFPLDSRREFKAASQEVRLQNFRERKPGFGALTASLNSTPETQYSPKNEHCNQFDKVALHQEPDSAFSEPPEELVYLEAAHLKRESLSPHGGNNAV